MSLFEDTPINLSQDDELGEQFDLPSFKPEKQNLKTWTAQDFSNIYVRFHPHLIRHARRFLTNHAQAEEVVQDAFLYLMTSLPEIDSEIGVLKLLKWKVRLLALDVISAEGRVSFSPVETVELADTVELSETLVRADDAAIVSMALAKLSPRQREAIISSVYQEKPTSDVAAQLGLSENATRQLLLRAKSAFKKALVGEAETAGLSVSQILSVAARKAAGDATKYLGAASAIILVLAVGIGLIPNVPQLPSSQLSLPESRDTLQPIPDDDTKPGESADVTPEVVEPVEVVSTEPEVDSVVTVVEQEPVANNQTAQAQPSIATEVASPILKVDLASSVGTFGARSAGFAYGFGADREQLVRELWVFDANGMTARVDLVRIEDTFEYSLENLRPKLELADQTAVIKTGRQASAVAVAETGRTLTLSATELLLLDSNGQEYLQQPFSNSSITVSVELDINGQVIGASLFLNK